MRSVPTGRKVVFATPFPDRPHEEDIDALDPLLGLDLADTVASDHYDDLALPRDAAGDDPADIGSDTSPTVTERLDGLMPSVAVLRQMIEDKLAFDLRERLAGGQTTFLILRYPSRGLGWEQLVHDAAGAFLTLASAVDRHERNIVTLLRPKDAKGLAQLSGIAALLPRTRVVVGLSDTADESLDAYAPYADQEMSITALAPDAVADVLDRGLGPLTETDRQALAAIGVAALTPAAFDLAVLRSHTAAEAIGHLQASVTAARHGELRRTASAEPTLETLPGYGSVMGWAKGMAADIRAYAAGSLAWHELDPGALFTGPPGTGKTLLAGALARSAGCRFIASSAAAGIAEDGGSLGAVVKAIRRAFAEASAELPTILFIDEIDSSPARGSSPRHSDYWGPIVNALLEALDGSTRREGLIVLAACNHPVQLDPAILRSGRLDRIVPIGLPSAADLQAILRYHMPGVLGDDDAERVASLLEGTATGADVQRIAREARTLARAAGRQVGASDLLAVALPPDTRSESARWRVAVHEAGHAVAQMVAGRMPVSVSIVAFGPYGGAVRSEALAGEAVLAADVDHRMVVPLLAARAAKEVILGSVSAGAGGDEASDLAKASALVTTASSMLGLGSTLLWSNTAGAEETERRLRRLYGEAVLLVLQHREAVEALARLLMRERIVGRKLLERLSQNIRWEKIIRHSSSDRKI